MIFCLGESAKSNNGATADIFKVTGAGDVRAYLTCFRFFVSGAVWRARVPVNSIMIDARLRFGRRRWGSPGSRSFRGSSTGELEDFWELPASSAQPA